MILPLALLVVLAFLPGSYAFGAGKRAVKWTLIRQFDKACDSSGNIPGHAYLEGKCYVDVTLLIAEPNSC